MPEIVSINSDNRLVNLNVEDTSDNTPINIYLPNKNYEYLEFSLKDQQDRNQYMVTTGKDPHSVKTDNENVVVKYDKFKKEIRWDNDLILNDLEVSTLTLDGELIEATGSEINILKDAEITTEQLNFLKTSRSDIQIQIDEITFADSIKSFGITSTTDELNLLDGSERNSENHVVKNDDGLIMNQDNKTNITKVQNLDTYLSSTENTLTNKTLTEPIINNSIEIKSQGVEPVEIKFNDKNNENSISLKNPDDVPDSISFTLPNKLPKPGEYLTGVSDGTNTNLKWDSIFTLKKDNNVYLEEGVKLGLGIDEPETQLHIKGEEPNITVTNTSDSSSYITYKNSNGTGLFQMEISSEDNTKKGNIKLSINNGNNDDLIELLEINNGNNNELIEVLEINSQGEYDFKENSLKNIKNLNVFREITTGTIDGAVITNANRFKTSEGELTNNAFYFYDNNWIIDGISKLNINNEIDAGTGHFTSLSADDLGLVTPINRGFFKDIRVNESLTTNKLILENGGKIGSVGKENAFNIDENGNITFTENITIEKNLFITNDIEATTIGSNKLNCGTFTNVKLDKLTFAKGTIESDSFSIDTSGNASFKNDVTIKGKLTTSFTDINGTVIGNTDPSMVNSQTLLLLMTLLWKNSYCYRFYNI